jgi:hypothetical protein
MTPLPVRPRRLRSITASAALVAAATALLTVAPGPAPAQASAQTYYASPGDNLAALLTNLRPGDSLLLRPGVYDVGYLRPNITPGTPNAVISFGAADRAHPPLLRGLVKLFGPSYWVLSGLRVQATQPSFEALYMGGGTGWRVMNSEFFGARQTGAYDNVAIANDLAGHPPRGFQFVANCVHDAARTTRHNQDHNMYVLFAGDAGTHGSIDHNIIYNHPNGEGIKLGVGGVAGTRGPWGVSVTYNTIVEGGRQILMTGDVRNNAIYGNILSTSRAPFSVDPRTTAMYLNHVTDRSNWFRNNYFWYENMVKFDPALALKDRGDDKLRPDPGFVNKTRCGGWQTSYANAAPYGRWGTARFVTW